MESAQISEILREAGQEYADPNGFVPVSQDDHDERDLIQASEAIADRSCVLGDLSQQISAFQVSRFIASPISRTITNKHIISQYSWLRINTSSVSIRGYE